MEQVINLPDVRVLVVDDAPTNLAVARNLLKRYNMHIDCVTSGPGAIEAIRKSSGRYDAIFMDYLMPGMDGVEATQRIREIGSDYAKNIPIIAFTSNTIVDTEEMFLQKGFQAYISKPLELSSLNVIIREWICDKKEKPRPKKEQPDGETLEMLHDACSKYDVISAEEAIEKLKGFEYETGGDLVEWLIEKAEMMSYSEIVKRLRK